MSVPVVTIRPATTADAEWIMGQVPRLHEFGPPPWRTPERMNQAEREVLSRALQDRRPGEEVLVAQGSGGAPLGFLHVVTLVDYFTGERHGHVSSVVVSHAAAGQGVGRLLMEAAEAWARAREYRLLTLSVFGENERARGIYERLSYRADMLRMVKVLA